MRAIACLSLIMTALTLFAQDEFERPRLQRVETLAIPPVSDKWARKANDVQAMELPMNRFLEYVATISGLNIAAENAGLENDIKKMTARIPAMKQVTWRTLLQAGCEQHGLRIDERQISGNVLTIWRPARITVNVNGAELRDVIWSIANQAKLNIIIDQEVSGTVSAKMIDVPWDTALDAVLKSTGYVIAREQNSPLRITR